MPAHRCRRFVRVDDNEVTTHNPIAAPDHVVIIDPSLIGAGRASGMKIGGAVVLNTEAEPGAFADIFPGRRVATVDANGIAVANRLGSQALPIVNTTILGAIAKVLGLRVLGRRGRAYGSQVPGPQPRGGTHGVRARARGAAPRVDPVVATRSSAAGPRLP